MPESSIPTATRKPVTPTAAQCASYYILLVALCALLRATASYFGRPAWIINSMPWPEVFYGPAIAIGTIYGVSRLSPRIETWLRRRRGA